MSEKEQRRRKIARAVMKRAWHTYKKCFISWSSCLRIAWKTVRFKQPIYFSKVYGTTFEGRQGILKTLLAFKQEEISLFFQREDGNRYDFNAIKIIAHVKDQNHHIGYVSKEWARSIAPLIDSGHKVVVLLSGITGGLSKGHYLGVNYEFIVL